MDLRELGKKFASDKLYWHSYFNDDMYPRLFASLKQPITKLLEIGIGERGIMQPFLPEGVEYQHGSSLKIWREYFPEADIYGADIREDVLFQDERIHTMRCDQAKMSDLCDLLDWVGHDVQIVIEDGSHRPEDQMLSAAIIVPQLQKDSLYICEDAWPATGNAIAHEFGGEFWQGEKGRDDGLVIIKR